MLLQGCTVPFDDKMMCVVHGRRLRFHTYNPPFYTDQEKGVYEIVRSV